MCATGHPAHDAEMPWGVQPLGALPFAVQHHDLEDATTPGALIDEVIARRIQPINQLRLTLLDQNRVITPHKAFRIFATTNTVGLGDTSGLYHGTQQINQGQMDRWSIVCQLNYLPHDQEEAIVLAKSPTYDTAEGKDLIASMVRVADMTRNSFIAGDINST